MVSALAKVGARAWSSVRSEGASLDLTSKSISQTTRRAPKIREAEFEDYDRIAATQVRYGRPVKNFEEWKHQWINNPAFIQVCTVLPIGWVLEREDNEIVGYLGNIPLFYELDGQRLLASVAHAWVVDEQYRPYSLMLLDQYFSQKKVELFLNATVGPSAVDAFAVFQSLPVPQGDWDRSAFWITNHQGFLAGWLAMRAIPFAKPLSYALAVAPFVKQVFAKRMPSHSSGGVVLHRCKEFDHRFDVFWDALKRNNPNVLLGVRSREVLEWHFRYALRNDEAWIVTAEEGPSISAYSIFLRCDNPSCALKRIRLVDYQTLDGSTALLLPMLSWALEKCRKEGIDMLEVIGFRADKSNIITRSAPYKRKLPCWLYYYKTRDRSLGEKLSDLNVWDPSQFDGDASL
jgi:hypothetical protein